MVKKLLKHEFKAWLRVVPFFWLAVLGVATAGRIVQFFESDSVYYGMIFGSSMVAYGITAVVVLLTPTVFGVYRFYRNLFTGEGYLSFTLPVTAGQHLWVKTLTAVCFDLISVIVLLLSGVILMSGDVLTEVLKAAAYLLKKWFELIPREVGLHLAGYLVEFAVLLLITLFGTHLMYQSCICIGQLARKNRVLLAVGVYFGYQLVWNILSTVMALSFTMMGMAGVLDQLVDWANLHPYAASHLMLSGMILLSLGLAALYWWISHSIMRKRLNLE